MPASPKEFREFAQECLRWRDETKSERHRQVLLGMATTHVEFSVLANRWVRAHLAVGERHD